MLRSTVHGTARMEDGACTPTSKRRSWTEHTAVPQVFLFQLIG